jgi:hypothetical protein
LEPCAQRLLEIRQGRRVSRALCVGETVPPVKSSAGQLCTAEANGRVISRQTIVTALLTHLPQPPIEGGRVATVGWRSGQAGLGARCGGDRSCCCTALPGGRLLCGLLLLQLLLQLLDLRLLRGVLLLLLLHSVQRLLQLLLQLLLLLGVHGGRERNRKPGTGLETKCDRRVYATVDCELK